MSSSYNASHHRHKLQAAICPITMGMPTSMTDAGFAKACAHQTRDRASKKGFGFGSPETTIYDAHCEQCGGEYPPELTIIKLEEIDMGSVTTYQGTCEMCLKPEKTLRKVLDKKCCSTCEHIRRAAHKSPEILVDAIRDAQGGGYLDQYAPVPVRAESDTDKTLKLQLQASRDAVETLTGVNTTMAADYSALEQMVKELRECNGNLQMERLEMLDSLDAMKGKNSRYGQRIMAIEENIDFISDQRNEALKENLALIQEIEQLKKKPIIDATTETQLAIADTCDDIRDMLIAKNQSYGNSALEPIRLFSKASPREQILVRLDDKLSRLSRGNEYPGDNTIKDLIGYLVLLLVQESSELAEVA